MAETIDEITITYEENGVETVKELDKQVLTKGAWSTLMFKFQEWSEKDNAYGPVKYTIRRYQKRYGEYKQKSKFNITNAEQAKKVIEILQTWIDEDEANNQEAASA